MSAQQKAEDSVAERVAKGAALLDEKKPGWCERIDLAALNQMSPCGCVLGQLWHDEDDPLTDGYWPALAELGIRAYPTSGPAAYGFADRDFSAYRVLDAEWRSLIEARRAGESRA